MLPDEPWLRLNPSDGALFWTDECEEIAREEPWGAGTSYGDAPFAEEPSLDDYRRALASGVVITPEKERYIRVRSWWLANDPVRHGEASSPSVPDFHENLLKLRALLDRADPNQRLMAAEVSRELRDFTTATELLDFDFPADYTHAVHLIKNLTSEADFTVRKLA